MDYSVVLEQITKHIATVAIKNNPIKESYSNLDEFMKAVESVSPKKEYQINQHIFLVYCQAFEQGSGEIYDNIIKCYQFRFNFGHSVLTRPVLKLMVEFIGNSKVLEVGAGNCYHGHALKLSGVDIVMTDLPNNQYPGRHMLGRPSWQELIYLDACAAIHKFTDRTTLLLIWPPPNSTMAIDSLTTFKGDKFIYIGEKNIDVNGTTDFFNTLESQWILKETIDLPHFIGVHDQICFYQRN